MIAQTPLAQSRIQAGGEVSVVLSTGAATPQVPPLVGQTLEQAKQSIEAAGLRVGPVSESNEGEPGKVTVGRAGAGTVVDPGTSVCADRGARDRRRCRSSSGASCATRATCIEKAGLAVGHVSEIYNEHKRGNLVLTQDPKGGGGGRAGTRSTWS